MFTLPKTPNRSGFTLIELLVVIAIIAVLATMGYAVYTNFLANARDGRRRADIVQIAKSIETVKNLSNGIYNYNPANAGADFPRGFPVDPNPLTLYCIATNSTTTPPVAPPTNVVDGSGCSPSPLYIPISSSYSNTTGCGNLGDSAPCAFSPKSWRVCAVLEKATTPFCISSLSG